MRVVCPEELRYGGEHFGVVGSCVDERTLVVSFKWLGHYTWKDFENIFLCEVTSIDGLSFDESGLNSRLTKYEVLSARLQPYERDSIILPPCFHETSPLFSHGLHIATRSRSIYSSNLTCSVKLRVTKGLSSEEYGSF